MPTKPTAEDHKIFRKTAVVSLRAGKVPHIGEQQINPALDAYVSGVRAHRRNGIGLFIYGGRATYEERELTAAGVLWKAFYGMRSECLWISSETARLAVKRHDHMRFNEEESYLRRMERVPWLVITDFGAEKVTLDWVSYLAAAIPFRSQHSGPTILVADGSTVDSLENEYSRPVFRAIQRSMLAVEI